MITNPVSSRSFEEASVLRSLPPWTGQSCQHKIHRRAFSRAHTSDNSRTIPGTQLWSTS